MLIKLIFSFIFFFSKLSSHEILVHYHVPKCAGITISSLMEQNYYSDEVIRIRGIIHIHLPELDLSRVDLEKIRFIWGHFPYRNTSLVPNAKNITFLRNPVDRVFSDYRYQKENGLSLSFEEFYKLISNVQVRYFTTLPINDPNISLRDHLESAKKNLSKAFYFVGIVEEMELSIKSLYRLLNWEPLSIIPIFNTSIMKPVDQDQYRFVYEEEWADRELYEFGKGLFRNFVIRSNEIIAIPKAVEFVDNLHFTVDQPFDGEGWGYREIDLETNRKLMQSFLREAYIKFPLLKNNYTFEFLAFSPPSDVFADLEVLVNGEKIDLIRHANPHYSKFYGTINEDLITDEKTKIVFKISALYVPSDHVNVPDHRRLGIGISEIKIKK